MIIYIFFAAQGEACLIAPVLFWLKRPQPKTAKLCARSCAYGRITLVFLAWKLNLMNSPLIIENLIDRVEFKEATESDPPQIKWKITYKDGTVTFAESES